MPKFSMTSRRPNPWGRRAKSDGSCQPKLKRPSFGRHSIVTRVFSWIPAFVFVPWATSYLVIAVLAYLGSRDSATDGFRNHSVNLILSLSKINLMFLPIMIMLVLSAIIGSLIIKRQLKARALQIRCLGCPRCGYDLSGRSDESQPCPECGLRISRRECVRLWCKSIRG